MKFEKIKLLYWSFWPIFLGVLFGSYYIFPKVNTQGHLSCIPAQTDAVILINPLAFFTAYKDLLEDDPTALKELSSIGDDNSDVDPSIGINPLSKVAIAHYSVPNITEGFMVIVELTNFKEFVKNANRRDNKPEPVSYQDGEYILLEKDDQIFFKLGHTGLLYQAQQGGVNEEIVQSIYEDYFGEGAKLIDTEKSFSDAVIDEDQISYWSLNSIKIADDINPQLAVINQLFNHKHIQLNIEENGFNTDATLELAKENSIIVRQDNEIELLGNECFRFAASVDPSEFANFFDLVLTEDKKYLIEDWNGGISASVSDFKDIELRKIHLTPTMDPLYPFEYDTVGVMSTGILNFVSSFEGQFSYPFFTIACELENLQDLKSKIENDTSISEVGDYYSYVLNDYFIGQEIKDEHGVQRLALEPQRIYFYFVENSIVFCPELPDEQFVPQYATFYLKFSFPKFVDSYLNQDGKGGLLNFNVDQFIVEQLGTFGLGEYELKFKEVKDGKIYLEGLFNLTETANHYIGFPLLINKIGSLASIPLF